MSDDGPAPNDLVTRWLGLDPDDPARHDARETIDAIGRDTQRDAAQATAALDIPLGDSSAHTGDTGEIAQALADLRRELDGLDPSDLDERPGWLARTLARVPGVGTPSTRYAQRLASSRHRIDASVAALAAARGVLGRDLVTLRADQERLHQVSAALTEELAVAESFADALVFAIDVELPFGDPRRPFFEDDLLIGVRRRSDDLHLAFDTCRRGLAAIETVMARHRDLMGGIDRTCELTVNALRVAAASTADPGVAQHASGRTSSGSADLTPGLDAIRAAFDEIDRALDDVTARRAETSATVDHTGRHDNMSEAGAATDTSRHEETR